MNEFKCQVHPILVLHVYRCISGGWYVNKPKEKPSSSDKPPGNNKIVLIIQLMI